MVAHISTQPFDPWQTIDQHLRHTAMDKRIGATASFVGLMRGHNDTGALTKMILEYYPQMTERYLERIDQAACARWKLTNSLIIHRVGVIYPGEPIVLIACWSAHRHAALDGCNWLLEELKTNVPLWKKETGVQGSRWVNNTDGDDVGARSV